METASHSHARCLRCSRSLPTAEFHRDKNRASGFYVYCKQCVSSYQLKLRRGERLQRFVGEHLKTADGEWHPSEVDAAWAAGFLEGEGSFNTRPRPGGGFSANISASQVNREPLDNLLRIFGGSVCPANGGSILVWAVHGQRALWVWSLVEPLMSERRKLQMGSPRMADAYATLTA